MLSRIAESLYWTGRYTERAEDTARLLDVTLRATLEGAAGQGGVLADVLGGFPTPGPPAEVTLRYSLDRVAPESIASCVRAARENARQIRDAITTEVWEALNTWHLAVSAAGPGDLVGSGAQAFLSAMKQRAFLLTGAVESTMPRTEGWHWLALGRHLERLVFTSRVVGLRSAELSVPSPATASPAASYGWTVLLRSLSAYESYRSTYRALVEPARVVEFLLLDPAFPRSALSAAIAVSECTQQIADPDYSAKARKLAGRLRSLLEFREVEDIYAEGLAVFARRLGDLAGLVHEALGEEQFARGGPQPVRRSA